MKKLNTLPTKQFLFFFFLLAIFVFWHHSTALAQNAFLVKDINPALDLKADSNIANFVNFKGLAYFTACEESTGCEIWKTDGTPEGTSIFMDLRPGPGSGIGNNGFNILKVIGEELFLISADVFLGTKIWKTDGTPLGTTLVGDIWTSEQMGIDHLSMTNVNGLVFFRANDGLPGLWASDGTEEGTILLKHNLLASGFSPAGDTLFFIGNDLNGTLGPSLWKSDGTPEETVMVKNISHLEGLTDVNGTLFFSANDGVHGKELWKSDGTEAGTIMVKDIYPGFDSGTNDFHNNKPISFNGMLFFPAFDGTFRGLWKSDGTPEGTVLVKELSFLEGLFNANGTLFFSGSDDVFGSGISLGRELWKSDGTEEGTVLVRDLRPGHAWGDPHLFTVVNGTLFFMASSDTGGSGLKLWKSDGTLEGTTPVSSTIFSNVGFKKTLFNLNGLLLFSAEQFEIGLELWRSDGTEAGTNLLKHINRGVQSSNLTGFVKSGSSVFFVADQRQLWKSDGTEAGTILLKTASSMNNPAELNGEIFFSIADFNTCEFWKTDGSLEGTVLVSDSLCSDTSNLIRINDTLFGLSGLSLWKTDGTVAGTSVIKALTGFPVSSELLGLTNINGTLFFAASRTDNHGLWKSDGTPEGTQLVKTLRFSTDATLSSNKKYEFFIDIDGTLFFVAEELISIANRTGLELWKSDGTPEGTVLVKDIYPGAHPSDFRIPFSSLPNNPANVDGTLFFAADDGIHGRELWKSDGTPEGTVMVKDIKSGAESSIPETPGKFVFPVDSKEFDSSFSTNINGTLFFSADDGVHGKELWKSDGTEAGTLLVKDIQPESNNLPPHSLIDVNGILYFSANNGIEGPELWRSDGTEMGTVLVDDIDPGIIGSLPKKLFISGNTLFFEAFRMDVGRELFALTVPSNQNDGDIALSLPSGVTVFFNDNTSSNVLHPDMATAIATADVDNNGEDDVIVSFPAGSGPTSSGGTWVSRNQGALTLLDSKTAVQFAVGDFDNNGQDDLLIDFGADNLWLALNDTPPFLLVDLPLTAIAAGDLDNNGQDDMIFSFTGIGTFTLKNLTTFDVLDNTVADVLSIADVDNNGEDDVVASFPAGLGPDGTGGTYVARNQGALTLLDNKTAVQIAVGDFDDNGQDDLLIDFGADNLWLGLDDTPPFLLIDLPITALAAGDLDNNGQDDMIFSFTGIGTFTLKNLATFDVLDPGVAVDLATGNVDGN